MSLLEEIYNALHPGSLSAQTEGSDHHDNRTPSGCLASYRSPHAYPADRDRDEIYWGAVVDTLFSKEDCNCTLVAASVLAGVSYEEVREGFRHRHPEIRLDTETFDRQSVREHGLIATALASYVGELMDQPGLPVELFMAPVHPRARLADVPQSGGALVTCTAWFANHMVACVEGRVYGLKQFAAMGGLDLSNMDINILPMDLVPKVPVAGWVEFRRE